MTDQFRPEGEPEPLEASSVGWAQPAAQRRRRRWGFLPWLIGAVLVLVVAGGAGLGAAYLLAEMRAASPPQTALPDPTPTLAATRTPAPTAGPTQSATATPTEEPLPTDDPPESPVVEATPREHIVARGESISLIAEEYGVTIESIIELNELNNPNVIVPGQRLLIPPP